jgi:short-chain 2-methylacyl-CoA dehydrogenase
VDFDLNRQQEMIRKEVRKFAESEIAPVAAELDETETFSSELTEKMGEIGLFGMFVSEAYGGQELDYISYIIGVEEIARVDGSQAATVAAGNSLGIGPIYYFGTEDQKKKYLPKLCTGEALWGFGLTEPTAGSDAGGSKTTAVRDGNEWVINGSKIFITNAACELSLGVTVQAITGRKPDGKPIYTCFLVENGTPGFKTHAMHGKMMWRASNTAELFFDDVRIPAENILGEEGHGFHQMLQTLDGGRLSIGAMGLGGAQGAYEAALKYARNVNSSENPSVNIRPWPSNWRMPPLSWNARGTCFTRPAGLRIKNGRSRKRRPWPRFTVRNSCTGWPTTRFKSTADMV